MRTRDRINREFKMENWLFMMLEVISRAARMVKMTSCRERFMEVDREGSTPS